MANAKTRLYRSCRELAKFAEETATEREMMRMHYVLNPPSHEPISGTPDLDFDENAEYDALLKLRLDRRDRCDRLSVTDVAVLRQYMLAVFGFSMSRMSRETGISTETFRRHGRDLVYVPPRGKTHRPSAD